MGNYCSLPPLEFFDFSFVRPPSLIQIDRRKDGAMGNYCMLLHHLNFSIFDLSEQGYSHWRIITNKQTNKQTM